jgi:Mg-chelatase subunit ChlD
MKYTPKDYTNGFTLNVTKKVPVPDIKYINKRAKEKKVSLGPAFTTAPKILQDLYALFKKEEEDLDDFDVKNYLMSRSYLESDVIMRSLNSSENSYYTDTVLFLLRIDFGDTVGITPMDKALNVLMHLTHLSTKTNPDKSGGWNCMNDPKVKNVKIQDEEQLASAIGEMSSSQYDENGSITPGGGSELSETMTSCIRDYIGDITMSVANIYGYKKPSDVPINRKFLKDIKIKSYLEDSEAMGTDVQRKKVRSNDSNERHTNRMEDYGQISKVNKTDLMMENFDDKFVKKEINVKEKMKPKQKKQILYMLTDDSASMANLRKQTYVRAVLMNRLESVVDGKSELHFYSYTGNRYNYREVKDLKQSQELYREIALRRPPGGGTNIGAVLQETIDEIANKQGYHDPEIMIVCDGDDKVNPSNLNYKGVRINVIILGTTNEDLKQIATDTNGFYSFQKLYDRY